MEGVSASQCQDCGYICSDIFAFYNDPRVRLGNHSASHTYRLVVNITGDPDQLLSVFLERRVMKLLIMVDVKEFVVAVIRPDEKILT